MSEVQEAQLGRLRRFTSSRFVATFHLQTDVRVEAVTLHLEDLWIKDVTITTGLVDTYSTPTLPKLITNGQAAAGQFVTHHFDLDDLIEAYDIFSRAADSCALKVVLSRKP